MTIWRGPGGTGSASSEVDTTQFQEFLVQAQAAQSAAEAAKIAAELAEVNAETAETSATASAASASASATSAAASLDAFEDRYLGAKASDPTVDNDGNALVAGTQYFNTVANEIKVYNGTSWQSASVVGGTVTNLTVTNPIVGSVTGNAATVTDGVVTTGSYANPSWLTSLGWSKVTSTPTTIAGYGITNAYTKTEVDTADALKLNAAGPNYTGTLTGGTGVVNLGSGQFYKDSSGNVGIGTSSPVTKVDVAGATRTYSRAANGGPNNTAGNNIWWYIGSIRLGDSESATLRMDGTQSYGAGSGIAGCTYLHLRGDNSNGLSGYFYGTSSGEFTVRSIAYKATATTEQFDLWVQTAEFASAVVYCDTNGVYAPASTGTGSATQPSGSTLFTSVWTFTTGGVERARIDSSGNLLVGTTNTFGGARAVIVASSAVQALTVANTATADSTVAINVIKTGGTNSTSQRYIGFTYNGGGNGNGAIAGNGDSQATFITLSDARLKENITDLPSQLDNVMALRPVEFDYKATGGHQIGFIAQEVQAIYPDLVSEGDGGYLTLAGFDKNTARLIKAIQEQQAVIESLTARVAALEAA